MDSWAYTKACVASEKQDKTLILFVAFFPLMWIQNIKVKALIDIKLINTYCLFVPGQVAFSLP